MEDNSGTVDGHGLIVSRDGAGMEGRVGPLMDMV